MEAGDLSLTLDEVDFDALVAAGVRRLAFRAQEEEVTVQHDMGAADFAPLGVRYAHHRDFADGGVFSIGGLDLGGIDVLAAGDDDVVAAIENDEESVAVQNAHIARVDEHFRSVGDEQFDSGNYRKAAKLLDELTQQRDFADFLTSEAYPDID